MPLGSCGLDNQGTVDVTKTGPAEIAPSATHIFAVATFGCKWDSTSSMRTTPGLAHYPMMLAILLKQPI